VGTLGRLMIWCTFKLIFFRYFFKISAVQYTANSQLSGVMWRRGEEEEEEEEEEGHR
jgi:hypothetical protein